MNKVSIVMPYYMNPGMLKKQMEIMAAYGEDIKPYLEFVLVDDASPIGERAEERILTYKAPGVKLSLYRILTDLRWNQHGARNVGAKEANHPWLLLTDIDHIVPEKLIRKLVEDEFDPNTFYMFQRKKYTGEDYHFHPNSYFMTKEFFWRAGGYDETYCGHYGTDGHFNRQCQKIGKLENLKQSLVLVGRDDIPDASTRTLQRKESRDPDTTKAIEEFKRKNKITKPQVLRLPWKKVL